MGEGQPSGVPTETSQRNQGAHASGRGLSGEMADRLADLLRDMARDAEREGQGAREGASHAYGRADGLHEAVKRLDMARGA